MYQRESADNEIELISEDQSAISGKQSIINNGLNVRIPRILACEHTFCQVCLLQNCKSRSLRSGTEIKCFYRCEKVTRNKVEDLLINQTALKLIDQIKQK